MRARSREMCLPEALSVEGEANEMADVASRSFNVASGYLYTDAQLLTHFEQHFPLPQNRSWRVVTLSTEDVSKVISTLRGQRLTMAQWTSRGAKSTGNIGNSSPKSSGACLPTLMAAPSRSGQQSSQPLLSGSGKESTAAATELLCSLLTERSASLGRPSSWLEGMTQ